MMSKLNMGFGEAPEAVDDYEECLRTCDEGQIPEKETLQTEKSSVSLLPRGCPDGVSKNQADMTEMMFPDEKDDEKDDGGDKGDKRDKWDDSDEAVLDEANNDNDLPFDSFSMLFVAKWDRKDVWRSLREFCLPIGVFAVQMLIMILLMINLLVSSDRQLITFMNIPVDAPITVKISQYIACMVSVCTADDLVTGVVHVGRRVVKKMDVRRHSVFADGPQRMTAIQCRTLLRRISEANRRRTSWKWELTNSMRMIEGALVIVVSFVFILQSVTAIDLWLNFAAVQFVGMLDDTAYHLSINRFLGSTARGLANRVTEYEVYSEGTQKKKSVRRLRLVMIAVVIITMWTGLSVIVNNQAQLIYACSSITVTVGENRHQYARHFSGRYIIQDDKINGRAVYVQEQGNGAFLAYCTGNGIHRWSISPLKKDEIPRDPCGDIKLQSHRTKTFDVSEIGEGMQFWTGDIADADIKCNQCDVSRQGGDCSFRGTCDPDNKLCECDRSFFGDSCQFSGPCTEMAQHEEFHGLYARSYQKRWDLMYLDGSPVMVYDRPVYVQNTDDDIFDVVLFDGGRWFVSQSDYFSDWYDTYNVGRESPYLSLAKYLVKSFNARNSEYIASYISVEPSTLGSPSNVQFRAWLAEAAEDSIGKLGEEEYELLCADCENEQSGMGLSFCVGTWGQADYGLCKMTKSEIHGDVNRCECLPGFSGPLCRLRPVEGTSSLHLDHATGTCSTCYEGNPWTVWDIDGIDVPCASMGKLYFEDGDVTFSRELGLHLNASHFSVFVSSTDDRLDTLCLAKEGTKEVYAIRRDSTDERIRVNAAIHLDNRKDFFGEVAKPREVECLSSTEIDHDVCSTSLAQVYSTSDMKSSMLKHAWLLLDLKVTPNQGDDPGSDDLVMSPIESESSNTTLEVSTAAAEEADKTQHSHVSPVPAQNDTSLVASPSTFSSDEATLTHPTDITPTTTQMQTFSVFSDNGAPNMASATSQEYVFAVIPKSITNAFFRPVKTGCEERAAALSRQSIRGSVLVKCIFVGPTDIDAEDQAKIAMDLISSGSVDGISMSVIDEAVATEVIDSAVAASIPIITFDSDAPSSKRAAYVGTDQELLGEELGNLLMTRFATSGKYAVVSNVSPNLFLREKGVRNILNENGWSEVSGSPIHTAEKAHESRTHVELMYDLMVTQPDIDAMLLTLGRPMRAGDGSWERFVQQYPDLLILSADSMPDQIDILNRGFVNGLVGQQPVDMGSKSIDTLLALSKGKAVEDFVATSLVIMGRVNEGTPYIQVESSSTDNRTMGYASIILMVLLILSTLALVAMALYVHKMNGTSSIETELANT